MNYFVHETARLGERCQLGYGVVIEEGVHIGDHVRLGHHVVIRAGARIEDGTVVEDGAVIGRQPRSNPIGTRRTTEQPGTHIGPHCIIGTSAVVYAGVRMEEGALVGDLAYVREGSSLGPCAIVGTGVMVGYDVRIGANTKIQTGSVVLGIYEDDVFIGPGVTTADDLYMDRFPGTKLIGPTVKRGARVGAGVTLYPGVTIGRDAVVAAGAVVMKDVPDRKVVAGVPAKVIMDVVEEPWLRGAPDPGE